MKFIAAFRALIDGITNPERVQRATVETALAVFAVAVMLLTATDIIATNYESADAQLIAESQAMVGPGSLLKQEGSFELSGVGRQFTAILGGSLIRNIVSLVILSALTLGVARFLTDKVYGTSMVLACVSAASGIEVIRGLVNSTFHVAFHTSRAGLHAGVFVDPISHPYWFWWLQRLDIFSIWFYLAFSIALTTWGGLHRKFGLVLGGVVFAMVQVLFGAFTVLAWIMGRGV